MRGMFTGLMTGLALACGAVAAQAAELRIARTPEYPPFITRDRTGAWSGYEIQLLEEVCARGNYECIWLDYDFQDGLEAAAQGEVDLAVGAISVTAERQARMAFTCPHIVYESNTGTFYALQPGGGWRGARVSVNAETIYHRELEKMDVTVLPYPSDDAALQALVDGQADVYFGNEASIASTVVDPRALHILHDHVFAGAGVAFAMPKRAYALRLEMDRILNQMSAEGAIERAQVEWFGSSRGDTALTCAFSMS